MSAPRRPGRAPETDPQVVEQLEIAAKYQGYIDRQQDEVVHEADDAEEKRLPADLDYALVRACPAEVQQKLAAASRPQDGWPGESAAGRDAGRGSRSCWCGSSAANWRPTRCAGGGMSVAAARARRGLPR